MTIGTRETARRAVKAYDTWFKGGRVRAWVWLGQGTSRTALLHTPTGVVYKIADAYAFDKEQAEMEQRLWKVLKAQGHKFVPDSTLYKIGDRYVTAMREYKKGTYDQFHTWYYESEESRIARQFTYDVRESNVFFDDDGQAYLIDGGALNNDGKIRLTEAEKSLNLV